jgi:hypothetical protein
MENMFEVAARTKMRFTFKGQISVEDLWDLTVENLDTIFKGLNSQLKQAQEDSLLNVRTKHDKDIDMQIEIIKYIVKVKQDEDEVRRNAKDKREQKQKLMAILADKQDADLKGKSAAEIQAMLAELGND